MIRCLQINDLAIIREVTLEIGPGLTLLTGETGAGKSILVDALSLVFGGRAGTDLIRDGAARAAVALEVDVAHNHEAAAFLAGRGYAGDSGVVVVRREIAAQGKGRAFIGGTLAPLADLRGLGSCLLDLHGQHQQQILLSPAQHRGLLDRHADLDDGLAAMGAAARDLAAAVSRLQSMREGAQRVAQRIDMLRFQAGEIDAADPRPGEREALRAERDLLRNAETILRHCRAAYDALYEGDAAALSVLSEGLREARALERFDASLHEDLERAEAARAEIEELALRLRDYPSRLSFEPHRLEAIEERLMLLEDLVRKYAPASRADEEGVLAYAEAARAELEQLTGGGESVADLEARVGRLGAEAIGLAADLSRRRRSAALVLEREVERILKDLGMTGTRFAVDFRLRPSTGSGLWVEGEEVAVDESGYDVVEFLLSANRGEALRPLASVASGGELSRLMLGLEVALRQDAPPRTLVFDEVDTGIGGAVAEAVGRRLRSLARAHQVICVTHLPQIASCAERHVLVSKRPVRGRSDVTVEVLDEAGRVRELGRMLAGQTVTPAALRHAAEMLARDNPG